MIICIVLLTGIWLYFLYWDLYWDKLLNRGHARYIYEHIETCTCLDEKAIEINTATYKHVEFQLTRCKNVSGRCPYTNC